MTYLLLICVAENVQLTPEESAAMEAATDSWVAEMDGRGVRREGAPLAPVSEAAVVRIRDGEVLVSDGPFAETKEQIAGYDVIECPSLAEAIEVAAKHPVARFGAVEVRPFDRGGWWLIRATLLERSTKPDLEWESRFTTLTVFVGSK